MLLPPGLRAAPTLPISDDLEALDLIETDGPIEDLNCQEGRAIGHHGDLRARCSKAVSLPEGDGSLRCLFREERYSHDRTTKRTARRG
jgi:hypothetical protein